MNPILRSLILLLLNRFNFSFFITGNANQLLFDGIHSDIQCLIHKINKTLMPDCIFGLMKNQNGSFDGPYETFTGFENINLISSIIMFNGSSELDYWSGPECNKIAGASNAELLPPAKSFGGIKSYRMFRPDLCRVFVLKLNATNIESDVNGLRTDRFRFDPGSFLNSTENPSNGCYQPNQDKIERKTRQSFASAENIGLGSLTNLLNISMSDLYQAFSTLNTPPQEFSIGKPSGVFDLSACKQGAPIYISKPHFLDADPIYLKNVKGLHPIASKHDPYFDIEPVTGVPVDFVVRMQVNVDFKNQGTKFPKIKSNMIPLMWQEFSSHITDSIAAQIRIQTKAPTIIAYSVTSLILFIGLALIIYATIVLILSLHRSILLKRCDHDSVDSLIDNAVSASTGNVNNNDNITIDNITNNNDSDGTKELV
ncbi:Scavenger receptor class B member 1 [Sarcoptes scabiei]|nr:Scavenger receptor class B member 1 [Sarcoptes scabiei]